MEDEMYQKSCPTKMLTVGFVNKSPHPNPEYKHDGDSGFDLRAWIKPDDGNYSTDPDGKLFLILRPLERRLIHTGIYLDLNNCEVQIRSRSGTALKKGLIVLNTPGTIDEPYTGEIGLIMINLSNEAVTISDGERIAQAVVCPVYSSKKVALVELEMITKNTDRGDGGFNSTGVD
jgi:dUTP pyrophosphatase